MSVWRHGGMLDAGRTNSSLVLGYILNSQCWPSPITGGFLPRIRYCPGDSPPELLVGVPDDVAKITSNIATDQRFGEDIGVLSGVNSNADGDLIEHFLIWNETNQ